MDFKFCPKCKTEKYISDFSPDKTTKSGFSSWFDTPHAFRRGEYQYLNMQPMWSEENIAKGNRY